MAAKAGRYVTPEQAAELAVRDGDWVDYGFGAGFPELMDKALAARKGKVKDVKIRGGLVIRPRIEVVEADPEQESFHYYSWHIGDYERKLQSRGLVEFLPVMLRSLPVLYRQHIRVDAAFVPVPMRTVTAGSASPTTAGARSSRMRARWCSRSTNTIRGSRA